MLHRTYVAIARVRGVVGLVCAVGVLWLILNPAMPSAENGGLRGEMESCKTSLTSELGFGQDCVKDSVFQVQPLLILSR